jgi:hypothetical protein
VIDTLNFSLDGGDSPGKDNSPSNKLEKLGNQDTSDLLNKTSVSIKNLNHTLIKLVATQQ